MGPSRPSFPWCRTLTTQNMTCRSLSLGARTGRPTRTLAHVSARTSSSRSAPVRIQTFAARLLPPIRAVVVRQTYAACWLSRWCGTTVICGAERDVPSGRELNSNHEPKEAKAGWVGQLRPRRCLESGLWDLACPSTWLHRSIGNVPVCRSDIPGQGS